MNKQTARLAVVVLAILQSSCGGLSEYLKDVCAINRVDVHVDEVFGPDGDLKRTSFSGIKDPKCAAYLDKQLELESLEAKSVRP